MTALSILSGHKMVVVVTGAGHINKVVARRGSTVSVHMLELTLPPVMIGKKHFF